MTPPKPDDRSTLVDPRVADRWRDASSEEPPASLDAAILAAARREVSARPEALAAWEAREVRASRRRWWPLAAAATVAAIAVGVLQVTPTDKLGAPATDSAIVSDVPAHSGKPESAAKRTTDDKPNVAAKPAPQAEAAPPASKEEKKIASNDNEGVRGDTSRKDSPRQPAPSRAAPAAPAVPPPAANLAQPATPPPSAEPYVVAPPPPAPARAPDPFPAAPRVAAQSAPPESAPSASGEVAASRAERTTPAAGAAPAATPAPAPAPLANMGAGRAADSAADDARARERTPLPVADWIALIRRLRTEDKQAEAAKELAAFRAAHPDHEKLLPPDLRDWRPPEK